MAVGLKRLLWCLPIPLVINDEFWTLARVKDDSMQPDLNPNFPGSSGLEDDIVMVKRTVESTNYHNLKGKVVMMRNPENPSRKIFRRLEAVQGDWVRVNEYSRRYVGQGQGWVTSSKTERDSRDFGMVMSRQVPLGLIVGEVTHIVWPPRRFQSLNKA